MLKWLAWQLLPKALIDPLRRFRRRRRKKKRKSVPMMSAEWLRSVLTNRLGLRAGDLVFVHSSLGELRVESPAPEVLKMLRDIVGDKGTLAFPCFSPMNSYDWLKSGKVFDVRKTRTEMGALSELARRSAESVRSLHPTRSVCAIGPLARELTATHSESPYAFDRCSPFYKLTERGGVVIGVGVSTEYLSFVHTVDDALQDKFPVDVYHDEIFAAPCIGEDGASRTIPCYGHNMARMNLNVPKLMKKYIPADVAVDMVVEGRRFFRADAKRLLDRMMELARRNITIYSRLTFKWHRLLW